MEDMSRFTKGEVVYFYASCSGAIWKCGDAFANVVLCIVLKYVVCVERPGLEFSICHIGASVRCPATLLYRVG